jgi:hypothetical protein
MNMYEDHDYDYDPEDYLKTCDRCGEPDLVWRNTENGWRLVDELGEIHVCKTDPKNDFAEFLK